MVNLWDIMWLVIEVYKWFYVMKLVRICLFKLWFDIYGKGLF